MTRRWLAMLTLIVALFASPAMAGESMEARVTAASRALAVTIASSDIDARLAFYRADARSMPEYQPALHGKADIAAYHRAMAARRQVTSYVQTPEEVIDLGGTALETGRFSIAWKLADGSTEQADGKYANLWASEPDGTVRLKSDVWGYFRPLDHPAAFFVALPAPAPPPAAAESPLAAELRGIGEAMAGAVKARDAEAQLGFYRDDAVYFPFADTPKRGIAAIRAHLLPYVEAGRGAAFDEVAVWNTGFEAHGDWVIEYAKFRVHWRVPDASGVTQGGGLRLWKRGADGVLKLYRQIGTHDAQ